MFSRDELLHKLAKDINSGIYKASGVPTNVYIVQIKTFYEIRVEFYILNKEKPGALIFHLDLEEFSKLDSNGIDSLAKRLVIDFSAQLKGNI